MFGRTPRGAKLCYWLLVVQLLVVQQSLLNLHANGGVEGAGLDKTARDHEVGVSADDGTLDAIQADNLEAAVNNSQANLNDVGDNTGLKGRFSKAISPLTNMFKLVSRFNKWRDNYNQLQQTFGKGPGSSHYILRDAMDVFRIEYAKIDKQLAEEACIEYQNELANMGEVHDDDHSDHSDHEDDIDEHAEDAQLRQLERQKRLKLKQKQRQRENVKLIVKTLKLLVERLEQRYEVLKAMGPDAALDEKQSKADAEAVEQMENIEKALKEASTRVRGIATRALIHLANKEAQRLILLFFFNGAATFVVNNQFLTGGALLSLLEPVILLLGTPNAPLLDTYWVAMQYRLGISFIKFSAYLLPCKRKKPQTKVQAGSIPVAAPIFPGSDEEAPEVFEDAMAELNFSR